MYEIVYDDEDVEELTWTDLQKLLRVSGDTVIAPAAIPPLCSEEAMPMSLPVAIQLQKDLMSKVALEPEKAAFQLNTNVSHVRQETLGPTSPVPSHESKESNG